MRRIAIAMVAAVLSMTGCAANGHSLVTGSAMNRLQGTPLSIENGTASPLRVYLLAGGYETPLARVEALGQQSVRIPNGVGSTIRLVARPSVNVDERRKHVSQPIHLVQGQRLTWELRASPGVSDVPHLSTLRAFACTAEAEC